MRVHRLTESWTESGATWFKRDATNNWTVAGGTYGTPASTKTSIANYIGDATENLDVTSLASGWYYGIYQNNGMILISPAENSTSGGRGFYNSEATGAVLKYTPALVVRYQTAPPPSVIDVADFA